MSEEEIINLITKFYNGDANEEDEKLLRALVSENNSPYGFGAEWEYIRFCFANTSFAEPSSDLTDKILRTIDESADRIQPDKRSKRYMIYLSGIAAALIITFGTYLFIESRSSIKDTYSDPELAYAETMKILMNVSSKLNKGTNALNPVGKLSTITNKSLDRINHSSSVLNRSLFKLNDAIKTTSVLSNNDTGLLKK